MKLAKKHAFDSSQHQSHIFKASKQAEQKMAHAELQVRML